MENQILSRRAAAEKAKQLVERSDMTKGRIAKGANMTRQWMARSLDELHPEIVARVLRSMGHTAEVVVMFKEKEV